MKSDLRAAKWAFVIIVGMSATTERDVACRIARTDFAKALPLARTVSEPWFRCQALAYVARYAPDERVVSSAKQAIAAAATSTEPYIQVAATAWPLRALIERNQAATALQLLPQILELAPKIRQRTSLSDAMFLLWEALFPIGGEARKSMTDILIKSCVGHRKGEWNLRNATLIVAAEDLEAAQRLAAVIPDGKYKRQAHKRLGEGQKFEARSFFHS